MPWEPKFSIAPLEPDAIASLYPNSQGPVLVLNLPSGHIGYIDEGDESALEGHYWYAQVRKDRHHLYIRGRKKVQTNCYVALHRVIMSAPAGLVIDHVNGNGLDNRRCNLRLCRQRQNVWNSAPQLGRRFKGIVFQPDKQRWRVRIEVNGIRYSGGRHRTPEAAARAYDELAKKHHGEFARLNFPDLSREDSA